MVQQKKIVLFSGTTEGREYSEKLCEDKISHIVCVATDYGKEVMRPSPYADIRVGRLNADEMAELFVAEQITKVVDATHPYAVEVTKNIRVAVKKVVSLADGQTKQEKGVEENIPQNDISYVRISRKIEPMDKVRFASASETQSEREILRQNIGKIEKLKQDKIYKNIKKELKKETRSTDIVQVENQIIHCADMAEAANFLQKTDGNILLTTGSKELKQVTATNELRKRLYVRVLPAIESMEVCISCGIERSHIIAMQGPFSVGMNVELLRQYNIRWLVTKNTGEAGGFPEKLRAAEIAGCGCVVIEPLDESNSGIKNQPKRNEPFLKITLCGIGAGREAGMTLVVQQAIQSADVLLGAARMLDGRKGRLDTQAIYRSEDILSYIRNFVKKNNSGYKYQLVVLFSGDTGFYSGCDSVYKVLREELERGSFRGSVRILPGVSSVSMLSAKIGVPYQNAVLFSIHGKQKEDWSKELVSILRLETRKAQVGHHLEQKNSERDIKKNKIIFILLSRRKNLIELQDLLLQYGQGNTEIYIGYNLFLEDEKVVRTTAVELNAEDFCEGLFTVCIIFKEEGKMENGDHEIEQSEARLASNQENHLQSKDSETGRLPLIQLADADFLRLPKLPMTKQEIRSIVFAKLELTQNAVFYDIGSGTGSIAITAAASQGLLADASDLRVLAFERNKEACDLIRKNANRLNAANLTIIHGEAPDIFNEIPTDLAAPTHAFIGGSGGRLEDIYYALTKQNPAIRIVITAITMETVQACYRLREKYGLNNMEVLQVDVARESTLGRYHSMERGKDVYVFVI